MAQCETERALVSAMLPVTDLSIARVQFPSLPEQDDSSNSEDDGVSDDTGSCAESPLYGDVFIFRAGGRCWAALCKASSEGDRPPPCLTNPAGLADALEAAARDGLVVPVSREAFDKGPHTAALEAISSRPTLLSASHFSSGSALAKVDADDVGISGEAGMESSVREAELAAPEAGGDGSIFRPFRFPTKMSDAFRLPWAEIGVVSEDQLRNFYEGTQMRSTPKRVIGAVGYLHHHYLRPFKQKIISKGRHLLVIKISETSGRRPQKRCLAWWMPLAEVRERYADPKKAEMYHEGGSVHRVCQLVETYKLAATVSIHFEIGERPRVTVGGFPLHCFDLDVDFHTRWSLGSDPDALLEEKREVQHCIATHSVLEMSSEARKAEKRRRKRQNKKARDHEKAAEDAQIDTKDVQEHFIADEERRRSLVQPNEALLESSFLAGLLDQMRQRKVALAAEKTGELAAPVMAA